MRGGVGFGLGPKLLALFLWLGVIQVGGAQSLGGARLTGFLLGVDARRQVPLRLLRFAPDGTGWQPADSVLLREDGAVLLTDTRAATTGLYQVALGPYSRTEVVLGPTEVPHFAATVAQVARQGIYLAKSPENQAYYDVLNLLQHYDTLISRAHHLLQQAADTSRAGLGAARLLERYHRNLNQQLRARQARYPGTYAATVLAPLAQLPERPAAQAGTPGYLPWLRAHYLDTFPFGTDAALRHWLGAARVGYFLNFLWPPAQRPAAADALLARRQGHDWLNAWLYRVMLAEALRLDDPALARYLQLNYAPEACAPVLPPALAQELAQLRELTAGAPLPTLAIPDSAGREVSLQQVAAAAPLTAVVVWVSWCHTCEAELPQLAAAYADLHATGLEVITISLDEQRAAWLRALRRQHPPWPHSLAELVPLARSQVARALHVRQTPKLLLIDQNSRLVGHYPSVAALRQAATAYLASR